MNMVRQHQLDRIIFSKKKMKECLKVAKMNVIKIKSCEEEI